MQFAQKVITRTVNNFTIAIKNFTKQTQRTYMYIMNIYIKLIMKIR